QAAVQLRQQRGGGAGFGGAAVEDDVEVDLLQALLLGHLTDGQGIVDAPVGGLMGEV
ncbi:hypothetical protein KMBAHK_KMBAHK_10080, partial [Dysosmobacter welbionis]